MGLQISLGGGGKKKSKVSPSWTLKSCFCCCPNIFSLYLKLLVCIFSAFNQCNPIPKPNLYPTSHVELDFVATMGWASDAPPLKNKEGGIFVRSHQNRKISLYKDRNIHNFSDYFMCACMHWSSKCACSLVDLNLFIFNIEGRFLKVVMKIEKYLYIEVGTQVTFHFSYHFMCACMQRSTKRACTLC